jgi:hypothetical protein
MLTFRFLHTKLWEILNLEELKKKQGEWLYGGYFSNTDEEGLEHFIFEVYNGNPRPYNRAIHRLKDKKQVDIWGDILENGWVISFKDGMFGILTRIIIWVLILICQNLEVGNIYETP